MRDKRSYWVATLIRGIIALSAGSVVLFVPDMARSLFLLPIAVVTAICVLVLYGIIDSVIILFTSYVIPWRVERLCLRIQGLTGIALGVVLISAIFSRVQLQWFLYFATAQVLVTAVSEFVIAQHALSRAISVWSYSAAAIALLCGILYWLIAMKYGADLTPRDITQLIFAYLLAFGAAQCLNAWGMLQGRRSAQKTLSENAAGQTV